MEKLTSGGVLVIDKPAGMTSHDVVGRVRRLYGTKQVGHTGTLDPMATGVLVLLVGRAVKASDFLLSEDKRYEALLRLGLRTDTEDMSGKVLSETAVLPHEEEVLEVCRSFVGGQLQVPPMYSALKVGGQKLVDLARKGLEVERAPRPITVYELNAGTVDAASGLYRLDVRCSKGTYIRSLCRDIGEKIGCGGVMAALRRTQSGPFSLHGAHTLEELEEQPPEERLSALLPLEDLFSALPAVVMPDFYRRLSSSGCTVSCKKLRVDVPSGQLLRLYGEDGCFYALGRVEEHEEGRGVKAVKQFILYDKDGKPCLC